MGQFGVGLANRRRLQREDMHGWPRTKTDENTRSAKPPAHETCGPLPREVAFTTLRPTSTKAWRRSGRFLLPPHSMTRRSLPCLVFAACCISLFAASPSAHAEPPAPGGGLAVYLFAGHSGWDTTALDARLGALGYSSFSQNPGSGGIGLRAWVDACKCTGALEFQFAMASANSDDGRRLSLGAGQFMVQAGRTLYARGNVRTYAMLGVGYGVSSLTLDPEGLPARARNPLGFADGSSSASNFALALQALVGVDYLVPLGSAGRGFNGLVIGLRAGYSAQPLVSSWSASNGTGSAATTYPVDLPRVAADGGFVHLAFGDLAWVQPKTR